MARTPLAVDTRGRQGGLLHAEQLRETKNEKDKTRELAGVYDQAMRLCLGTGAKQGFVLGSGTEELLCCIL